MQKDLALLDKAICWLIQKILEFETFEFAIKYLFNLKKWPTSYPVLTGSIFLVAEFMKFANKSKY